MKSAEMTKSTNAAVVFGAFIKEARLKNEITARQAAENAGMLPSNFSKIEHGVLCPPHEPEKQKALAAAVGISADQMTDFFDLAANAINSIPVDLAEIISRDEAIPLLLRTIGNKRLKKDQIDRLVAIVLNK